MTDVLTLPDGVTPATEISARPTEAVRAIVRTAAQAWLDALQENTHVAGFLAVVDCPRGPHVILSGGACDPPAECVAALLSSFAAETETWTASGEALCQRLEHPLPLPAGHHVLVHPLCADGRFAGVMAAVLPEAPSPAVLRIWARLAAAAACVAALYQDLETQRTLADALRALDTISHVLSSQTDLDTLYRVIHREVAKVMTCDAFYVCLYNRESNLLKFEYLHDQGEDLPRTEEPIGTGATTTVIRTCEPFVLNRSNAHVQHSGNFIGSRKESHSAIHVPMLVDDEPIGALSAQSYRANAYDRTHVQLLFIIAAKAAVAVRNAQLLDHIRGQVHTLEQLTQALQVRDISLGRVDDMVVLTDPDGRITAYNEAVTRTLGYSKDDLIGQPAISLRPSGRGNFDSFRRARNRRVRVSAKDGHTVPVLYNTEPLEEDGRVVGWLTVARNLTDLERSEEEGRAALTLERQRISRDLHDGLIQSLSIAKMQLQILQRNNVDETVRNELAELQETVSRGLTEARHYIVELKHSQMDSEGLFRTARRYASEMGRVTGLSIAVFTESESSPLSDTEEVHVFYILRETLNNVRKHAEARRVRIDFREAGANFRMAVEDDGKGFDPAALETEEGGGHWGLQHICERARALGGEVDIASAPGAGTTVTLVLPTHRDSQPATEGADAEAAAEEDA